mgnify:CR=1 FL=1
MDIQKLVEVLLFSSSEPLTQTRLNKVMPEEEPIDLKSIIYKLNSEYKKNDKGLIIEQIAGGYQILSRPEYHVYIERLLDKTKRVKLSKPALEVLSIIAYKQPLTRLEIESVRGVECGGVIKTLIERELVTVKGRDGGMGRALLYGTTYKFLEAFGINKLSDLPKLEEIESLIDNGNIPSEYINEIK